MLHLVAHSVFFCGVDRWRLKRSEDSRGQMALTSKKLAKAPPQKPLATISNLASSCLLTVVVLNVLIVMGCSVGSIATP